MASFTAQTHRAVILAACSLGVMLSVAPVEANTFLKRAEVAAHLIHGSDLSRDFLTEIEKVLGSDSRGSTEKRIAPMEVLLRPTLGSLPKNEHGRYSHLAVKYALHRLFVKRHGWFVHTLKEGHGKEASMSPTDMFVDQVPEYLQGLFEARLGSHGLNAHEVALLAAVLENLVHREVSLRLGATYQLAGVDNTSHVDTEKLDDLLDTYMALYLADEHTNTEEQSALLSDTQRTFPLWQEVRNFVREVREDRTNERSKFSFADASDVVERIADRYGRFQNMDCRALKKDVLSLHDDGTGLVPLSKFYAAALNGQWQFSESREYLRKAGALDESNPVNPQIIVANYVLSESNCVGSSIYYTQCCISECEDLLENLEREIMEPEAAPERILELVRGMASQSLPANRTLRPKLVQRLHEIAENSGGRVALHGRLFEQWMHHAYPRECPFPQVKSEQADEKLGPVTLETPESMQTLVTQLSSLADVEGEKSAAEESSPWLHQDVHYTEGSAWATRKRSRSQSLFRIIAFLAAAVSVVRFLYNSLSSMAPGLGQTASAWDKEKLV